ncbi:MAG: hypothetical protein JJE08_03290, partial [Proteiniphilum sp.]|nr:hypothetical protein [Proteiniphilum sp.]
LNLPLKNVGNTVKLFEEGATIPFISRYRKEAALPSPPYGSG